MSDTIDLNGLLAGEFVRGDAEALREANRRLELLSDTASQLLVSENPQGLVQSLCEKVMSHLGCHAFFNFLVDEDRGCLHLNAFYGIPGEVAKGIEWLDYGVAVCGCAARDACRIVAEDIFNTPDPRTDLVKGYGIQCYAAHPLLTRGGKVIGTLSFGSRTKTRFSDDELSLMKTVADQVAVAMDRIRLLESERRHVSALRESEQRFRDLADNISQLAWMADESGSISWYNKRWLDYTGTTEEQMLTVRGQVFVHPEYAERVSVKFRRMVEAGQPWEDTFPLRGVDGSYRWFLSRAVPIRDEQGRVVRWFGTNTDVTEQRKAEERERELQAQQQEFYRRTILAATGGRLVICDRDELSRHLGETLGRWDLTMPRGLARVREEAVRLAEDAGIAIGPLNALLCCIGESTSNALKHAGSGSAALYRRGDSLVFLVEDSGKGIGALNLPDVALTTGYSTAGTGGYGYKLMIRCAEKVYLATGPDGTTVAMEIPLKTPAGSSLAESMRSA